MQKLSASRPLKLNNDDDEGRTDLRLVIAVIDADDRKLAVKLLAAAPDDASSWKTSLLYAARRDDDAAKAPPAAQSNVVWSLLRRGDPAKALGARRKKPAAGYRGGG